MDYPEYAEVNGKTYKINTSFKIAIKCNEIAEDENIDDYERALAIIYLLFGKEGLYDKENKNELFKKALKFLSRGKEPVKSKKQEKPDMDFIEDYSYIKTSFRSDYGINLDKEDMHWWEFYDLINGLSNSDFGNCCIFNRVRNIRNIDLKEIKDKKERDKIIEAKKFFELKKNKKTKKLTKEQEESLRNINEILKKRKRRCNE